MEILSTQTENIYLHAFKTGQGWRAVLKGLSRDEQIVFENLPGKMLYLPVRCYNDAKRLPIGHPFILDAGGQVHNLKPNQQNLHSITVWRKYPLRKQWYNRWKLMLGSSIEVSDDSLFLNKKIVYTFNSPTESILNVPLELDKPYRYVRLQTDLNKRPEIAEFKIFSKNEKKQLIGNIIYHRISEQTVGQIFDNNYLTYAPKILRGYWVGLDLGEANTDTIGSIELCPRHDMNMIKQGDEYELFYYDMAWKSLGKKVATTDSLVFGNVPSNALLWLRNHTGGMEERPFTYENGKQVWW